jgi:hypothetical protein
MRFLTTKGRPQTVGYIPYESEVRDAHQRGNFHSHLSIDDLERLLLACEHWGMWEEFQDFADELERQRFEVARDQAEEERDKLLDAYRG